MYDTLIWELIVLVFTIWWKFTNMTAQDWLVEGLPWLLSSLTVWMTVLTGKKSVHSWTLGLFNQLLWVVWIVASQTWGLVPLNLTLWVLYYRNYRLWKREEALPPAPSQSVITRTT